MHEPVAAYQQLAGGRVDSHDRRVEGMPRPLLRTRKRTRAHTVMQTQAQARGRLATATATCRHDTTHNATQQHSRTRHTHTTTTTTQHAQQHTEHPQQGDPPHSMLQSVAEWLDCRFRSRRSSLR